MSYLTDGVHLDEQLGWCHNFGLAGAAGSLAMSDSRPDKRPRAMAPRPRRKSQGFRYFPVGRPAVVFSRCEGS
jgi:hypothetical protein